ncbi:hypothetical protein RS130_12465 [Paraglaciecola aquimarina]|uniref:Uncharacterized protein n=1 Tax=Paraglaciecola aquimarina TaxID=1235557 RepID=A0ABU3SX88_9ALTE|nr:hypothetical protein [Paraglaciecola aquimarina]MDU0354625.1 hypothetical protein [Paraglaciecola aquimarina]
MATKIRRLTLAAGWLLVASVAGLPVFGIVLGLWPSSPISWQQVDVFWAYNGILSSVVGSLFLAFFAPIIALYVAFTVYSQYRFNPRWQALEKRLAPLLSLPHLAVALGLVYLFSPAGMLWSGLWDLAASSPPEWFGLGRKSMLTMLIAISIKEVPFFY